MAYTVLINIVKLSSTVVAKANQSIKLNSEIGNVFCEKFQSHHLSSMPTSRAPMHTMLVKKLLAQCY